MYNPKIDPDADPMITGIRIRTTKHVIWIQIQIGHKKKLQGGKLLHRIYFTLILTNSYIEPWSANKMIFIGCTTTKLGISVVGVNLILP